MALARPLDWHFHPFWSVAIAVLVAAYIWATRAPDRRPTRRQAGCFALAMVVLWAAVTWPLGDLAVRWSLMALVLQRLLLTLAVPPLLAAGTPRPLIDRLTRPAAVDAVLRLAVKPMLAVIVVTVVAVGTLTVGAVNLAAHSVLARTGIELLVLGSGLFLWAPVLSGLPGAARLSSLARGGYLIVQSIVPSFLSVVWIFARHSFYPPYDHHARFAGMTPLLDQQLAGFLAKLSTIAVLWTVAYVVMSRGQVLSGAEEDGAAEPLLWSDVEREIERANRRERRQGWREWRAPG